ncbi:MAG: sigma 54-interacting transcriptional regulator [Deltaproteobacteria bacterium]|nr:sigma 54-interacting transcriptional regulator [Deltaproteobacteria bacterium]
MIKMTAVVPYKELGELFEETFRAHDQYVPKPEHPSEEEYELEVVVAANAGEVSLSKLDSDVIMARGGTAYKLRDMNYFIPVVEIPVSGHDLTRALFESKKRFGSKKIAAIGSINMIMGVENFSDILDLEIQPYVYFENSEIKSLVGQAAQDGAAVVIGGVKTCVYAKELGLEAIFLKTGKEAVWYTLTEAKRVAAVSRREQGKALRFKTILDYAYEGMISVDENNLISVFNAAAERTLNIRARDVVGRRFDEAMPPDLQKLLVSKGKESIGELIRYHETNLAVNIVPTLLKSQRFGTVLTFQDVTQIQEMENRIRKKIHYRGHVARHTFGEIVGASRKITHVIQTAKRFSRVDSNILLIGETGTGKELFAQSIHNFSHRNPGPFVAVNCAALPESLLESELFGYVEGAFTGAAKGGKPGLFELAHGGTIFLDEISEVSPRLQGRLLRVLQEKEITRLGHDRVIPVDIRIISATNRDLPALVKSGNFREDLYYRLDILKIELPPLRERSEDVVQLAEHIIAGFCVQFKKAAIALSLAAKEKLQGYPWMGNVRELSNMCERLVVLNQSGRIDETDVMEVLPDTKEGKTPVHPDPGQEARTKDHEFVEQVRRLEKERIMAALKEAGNRKSRASRHLGVSRTTLWRRLKKLEVEAT